jgi:hypothetical protein
MSDVHVFSRCNLGKRADRAGNEQVVPAVRKSERANRTGNLLHQGRKGKLSLVKGRSSAKANVRCGRLFAPQRACPDGRLTLEAAIEPTHSRTAGLGRKQTLARAESCRSG